MAMQKASTKKNKNHSMDSATDKTAGASPLAARQREQQLQQRASAPHPRQRVSKTSNACEACRSAKVKCQPSSQLGICRRCHDSKRECVFKTGPRTRRPRQAKRTNPESASTSGQPQQAGTTTTSFNSVTSASNTTPSFSIPLPGPASASGPAPIPGLGPGPNSGPGPSKTFTIDIPLPSLDDVANAFEELRVQHGAAIDGLGPAMDSSDEDQADFDFDYPEGEAPAEGEADGLELARSMAGECSGSVVSSHASSLPLGASALSTPPSLGNTAGTGSEGVPRVQKRTTASAQLGLRPQFNVESAAALLKTFREAMLPTFPCIVLDPNASVADMARDKPFVLLAALAAASSSRTLQGHSLYDEEFRKILGLKFVAGGERSAELLEGLIVYTAWYPFHLRPKNKQAFQYVRMAVDIVNDLEIDHDGSDLHMGISPERRTLVRLYLAIYFMSSHYATSWNRSSFMPYTAFTAQCIQLFLSSSHTGDVVLAWKARLQRLTEETHELRRLRPGDTTTTTYQIDLMVKGIEWQLNEWANNMAPAIAANPSVRISLLFCRIFILGAPLLKIPASRSPKPGDSPFRVNAARLLSVLPSLHALFDHFASMPPPTINAFCGADWGSLILAIVLGYRLSFPLPECPEWDDSIARHEVRFAEYLDKLCEMGGNGAGEDIAARLAPGRGGTAPGPMDILSASKVVMEMLRRKYRKRVAKLTQPKNHPLPQQQQQQQQQGMMAALWAAATGSFTQQPALSAAHTTAPTSATGMSAATGPGCPMLDGSVEPFLPYWDETFSASHLGQGIPAPDPSQAQAQQLGLAEYPDLWATISTGWAQDGTGFTGM